jgi:hypothetical protein
LSKRLKQSPQTTGSAKIKVPKKVQAVIEGVVCHNDCLTTQFAVTLSRIFMTAGHFSVKTETCIGFGARRGFCILGIDA